MTVGADVIRILTERGLTIAVAESLTGGLLAAELIATPGASAVVLGGVVAYDTRVKRSVLGVDAALLDERGAVDPEVARQMASGVRTALAVEGRPADVGISTTGVAGPDPQDGHPPGTVYLGFSIGGVTEALGLALTGGRQEVRNTTVAESLAELMRRLNPS